MPETVNGIRVPAPGDDVDIPGDLGRFAEDVGEVAQTIAAEAGAAAAEHVALAPVDEQLAAVMDDPDSLFRSKQLASIEQMAGRRFTPEQFGAKGDGAADDTAAVRACFEAANALARTGVVATIKHPGATVILTGTYNLASLAAPIDIMCNVEPNRATFLVPDAYAGVAGRVGNPVSGGYFQAAEVFLPDLIHDVNKPMVAGSVGWRTVNIGDSMMRFGRTVGFERGIQCSGDGQGTAYNTIAIGWVSYCKISLSLKPHTASGWCNQNTFVGGSCQQSPGYNAGDGVTGIRRAGWRHVELDGSAQHYINGNTFLGTSFEGDVSEYWLYAKSAADNHFIGTRHEQGTAGTPVTVAGDTLTRTAHGLSAGDMVTFTASVAPTGMTVGSPYYVVTTPDANTFKVAQKKGGAALTFTSAGTNVLFFRPPRAYFDLGGSILQNITVEKAMTMQGVMEVVKSTGGGSNLTYERPGFHVRDTFSPEDTPLYRARNSSGAAGLGRAVFAAYPTAVNPVEDPKGWTAALSDRGLLFQANGAETGLVTASSTGVLQSKRPADTVTYELATSRRTQAAGATLAASTVYTAGTRITGTVSLTGIAPGDYVTWSSQDGLLPQGLSVSAQVTAADTITYAVDNNTAADVTLPAQRRLWFKVDRRFF